MTTAMEAPARLSMRQQAMLELRLAGRGRRQIAEVLGLSKRTVDEEFDRARAATGAADELELLLYVDRMGRQSA